MKIKQLKIINQDQSTEIADIGADAVNIDYNDTNVKSKLDELSNNVNTNTTNISNEITTRANSVASLQSQIRGLASGSPKGSYATTAALVSANPDTGVYIITADGHIYSWTKNGSSAIDLGVYQATKIERKSIDWPLLSNKLQNSLIPKLDNRITEYSISNHTWYYWSDNVNPASDPNITNYFYPVELGELYYVVGDGAFYNRRGAAFVDSNLKKVLNTDVQPEASIHPHSAIYTDGYMYVDSADIMYLSALSTIKVYKIEHFTISEVNKLSDKIIEIEENNVVKGIDGWKTNLTKWNGAENTSLVKNIEEHNWTIRLVSDNSKFAGYGLMAIKEPYSSTKKFTVFANITLNEDLASDTRIGLAVHSQTESGSIVNTKSELKPGLAAGTHLLTLKYEIPDNLDITKGNIFLHLATFNKDITFLLNSFIVVYDDFLESDLGLTWQEILDKYSLLSFDSETISSMQNSIDILEDTVEELANNSSELITLKDGKLIFSNQARCIIDEQLKNDFAWKSFDKVYATMTFDDTNNDISTLEALAAELEIPLCWATIPSKLNNIVADGRTAKAVLQSSVARGSEVLAHWSPYLKHDSTPTDYYNVYIGAKKTLQDAGFEVNGIITAGGGTGGESYQTQDFVLDTKIARCYYQYADLTSHFNNSIEQFKNQRTFTDSGVQATKNYIDQVVAQGSGWINWASHGIQSQYISSIDGFREIWEYALSKGVVFTTWKYLYDNFKSSKLEKRIKLLENNTN